MSAEKSTSHRSRSSAVGVLASAPVLRLLAMRCSAVPDVSGTAASEVAALAAAEAALPVHPMCRCALAWKALSCGSTAASLSSPAAAGKARAAGWGAAPRTACAHRSASLSRPSGEDSRVSAAEGGPQAEVDGLSTSVSWLSRCAIDCCFAQPSSRSSESLPPSPAAAGGAAATACCRRCRACHRRPAIKAAAARTTARWRAREQLVCGGLAIAHN